MSRARFILNLLAGVLGALLCAGAGAQEAAPSLATAREQQALAQAVAALKASFVTPLDSARLSAPTVRGLLQEVDPEMGVYFDEAEVKAFSTRAIAPPSAPAPASLSSSRSADGALILRITAFTQGTLADAVERLSQEWKQQPFPGLVLDLRGSPGGLVTTATCLATLFLPADAVVARSAGRSAEANQVYRASAADLRRDLPAGALAALPAAARKTPLVVLVGEKTAAGAELLTAALQDHRRATIVGRTTLGRSSIQTDMPVANGGAIKFTVAWWLSPSGQSLHRRGVTPDVVVDRPDEALELAQALQALGQATALK